MTLSVIGGTGLTRMDGLAILRHHAIHTRFGAPSAPIVEGVFHGATLLFLPRHGDPHVRLPHQVNYRANLMALREAGADAIIAVNAVGGITADTGTLVIPDQIIDYTWGRNNTFFQGVDTPLVHVDFSWPFDVGLRARLRAALSGMETGWQDGGCYAATQGPRLETAAEIRRLERDGNTIVGMTGMPEAVLARELDLPYAMLSLVVNPAAGRVDGEISLAEIEGVVRKGKASVHAVLAAVAAGWRP